MSRLHEFLIGVDGGGTGTRVRIVRAKSSEEIARGTSGPSALILGIDKAWAAVMQAIDNAFAEAAIPRPELRKMALGLGLAGVHTKQWAAEFVNKDPGFGSIVLETDAFTTLLGAHGGKPGGIIAIGTGSVGEVLLPTGERREVCGWGFPTDEGSGSWMGLRAMNHIQHVLDGRAPSNEFARAVIDFCGGDRDGVFAWLARSNQTTYAQLAPLVIAYAGSNSVANSLMIEAGRELAKFAEALDPSGQLPIALCGGLSTPLRAYFPESMSGRITEPQADAAAGALLLIQNHLKELQPC